MENFIWGRGRGGLARSTKKFNLKTRLFYGKWGGGGLTQSIKSLTEKVKENPYWGMGGGGGGVKKMLTFSTVRQFLTYDSFP